MNSNLPMIVIKNSVKELSYINPEEMNNTCKSPSTRIRNAYREAGFIDDRGRLWFKNSRIADIIRTTSGNAQYVISNEIPDNSKIFVNGEMYIKGYEVKRLIDKEIQETGMGKKKQYLLYSEKIFNAIRDCDTAENLRNAYEMELKAGKKKLKSKRIRKYKILHDELTGKELIKKTSEFSHIRSYSIFKDIGDDIENGLIVNKEIHDMITKYGIMDEEDLLRLCEEKGWSTEWYNSFKECFVYE